MDFALVRDSPDPGHYNVSEKFGESVRNVSFNKSTKYPRPKINENPGPGTYSQNSYKVTKNKVVDIKIRKPLNLYTRPKEILPDPGAYQSGKLTDYLKNAKLATFKAPTPDDERLKFKPNTNPGPGSYPLSPMKSTILVPPRLLRSTQKIITPLKKKNYMSPTKASASKTLNQSIIQSNVSLSGDYERDVTTLQMELDKLMTEHLQVKEQLDMLKS